jgi:UMF1 family MFS transporter
MGSLAEYGARLGLDTRESVAWALYDWANSAFATTIVAAVFPIYYQSVIGGGLPGNLASVYFGYTTAAGLILVSLISPVLGAVADRRGTRKRFLGGFALLGVASTAGLFTTGEGDVLLASALFVAANIGFVGANVFYDSLLDHVATDANRLSAAGYALGYVGGGILLVINLAWILSPQTFGLASTGLATRLALLSVAVWWAVFTLPVVLSVSEPDPQTGGETNSNPVSAGFAQLRDTLAEAREYPDLFLFLGAFLLYADGIGTIIRMASIYGAEIGIGRTGILGALVVVQFVGIPFAFLFGSLPDRSLSVAGRELALSTKRALYIGLAVYMGISIGGFFMTETWHFWLLAIAVATVQGGTQALSRSMYTSLVPADKSAEFFSFYSVSSKVAGIAGPAVFAVVGQLTGSSRFSIVSLIVFFGGGAILLSRIDVEEGRQRASLEGGSGDAASGTTPAGDV